MSNPNLYSVKGKARFAKLFERNKDNNVDFHGEGGAYTIDVMLEKEELDKVTKSGSRLKPRLSDDGLSIKFKRKNINEAIPAFGGKPKVVDKDDQPWDDTVSVGNDSEVEVWFTTYDTKMGKGTRLEAVKVLELVEWEGDGPREEGDIGLPF
jgi:hypothetical protein